MAETTDQGRKSMHRLLVVGLFGIGMILLGGFLTSQGLDRADKWASVFGLFLNVAGVVAAAASTWLAWKSQATNDAGVSRALDIEPLRRTDPQKLGSFRILGRVRSGSMAQVYLGRSASGIFGAVKVMNAELVADSDFRERFRRELRDVRRVHGDHFLPLMEADADADRPWLATEYFPGLPLDEVLGVTGPWELPAAAWLARSIAEAFKAIHPQGIVHRDLNPSNVLVDEKGPRVIDFGLARSGQDTKLTGSGLLLGTVAFMSPEQAHGDREVGPASDIFALGSLLVYAATGAPPFGEEPWHVVLRRIMDAEPQLGSLAPADGSFAPLVDLIRACLAKDPADRPNPETIISVCGPFADQLPEQWLPETVRASITRRRRIVTAAKRRSPVSESGTSAPSPDKPRIGPQRSVLVAAFVVTVVAAAVSGIVIIPRLVNPAVAATGVDSQLSLSQYLSGEVKIGINGTLPGWSKSSDEDHATGFDVALIDFLKGKYGFTPKYVSLRPWERESALQTGRVKLVLANYSRTAEREKKVDFAGPYFHDRSGILCSDQKIRCGQPIPQDKICVTKGTIAYDRLHGAQHKDSIVDCMQAYYDANDTSIAAVSTDVTILEAYGHSIGSVGTVTWVDEPQHPITEEYYGIGIPDKSPGLCRYLNADIDEFLTSADGWDAAFRNNLSGQDSFGRKPSGSDTSWCNR